MVCFEILLFFRYVSAQQIEVKVRLASISPAVVQVEGRFLQSNINHKNWVFLRSFAGVENLGERISNLNLRDVQGKTILSKKLIEGEYLADSEASNWDYLINIDSRLNEKAAAHISWLKNEQGILMTGDLLPQFEAGGLPVSAKITFELPADWKISSSEKPSAANTYDITDIDKAVFVIGKNRREIKKADGKNTFNFVISGEWNFSDEEASKMAEHIFAEYRNSFGAPASPNIQVLLFHFPKEVKFGRWEADTRGSTSMVFSSDMPFKTLSLQRLHEQLRHEIFHLWIPGSVALTGNYNWFYEGFTVYEALKTGVNSNQIRFEDFLDTLSQASDLDNFQSRKVSLIEVSKRLSGAGSSVYSRGMLVAFLCDVALLRESGGKRSLEDVFRLVLNKYHQPDKGRDGTAAILEILESYTELRTIVEKYIKGTETINWQTNLESIGIQPESNGPGTKLAVKSKLNKRQKDLLNKLGYNNWRKILQ